ncbi:hypothetical protein [Desulfovibrio sp. TomC]|uniref:hypothetical protein n=1 Tax=Desulfovibrio sp. TomC TaxID=1562888 RepID=UPI0005BE2BFA|nr:hypothetical protein [Desulfovibrio sp. TomC]
MALSAPQPPADKAAMRQRRRWLARRRSLRVVRKILAFTILTTPFRYFGLVLCCHMPFGMQFTIPTLLSFYNFWIFCLTFFIFFKYIRIFPTFSLLPLAANIALAIATPSGMQWKTNYSLYFDQFYPDRMAVIRLIESGALLGFDQPGGVTELPEEYKHTSFPDGKVGYNREGNRYRVYFPAEWYTLVRYGFEYGKQYTKDNDSAVEPVYESKFIAPGWIFLSY